MKPNLLPTATSYDQPGEAGSEAKAWYEEPRHRKHHDDAAQVGSAPVNPRQLAIGG